uniref:Protein ygaD n=1 Tax=Curvibacter symbiont subsp. Hydra magnipapillata TaxID=667019 RepID=C9YEV9_CURXX|nr:Protein ygaD [Curvibacter putative symbiont of Hydra magnipapillata]
MGRPTLPRAAGRHRPFCLDQGRLGHHARRPGGSRLHADGDCHLEVCVSATPNHPLSNQELLAHIPSALLADLMLKRQWMLTTAESCTGGMIAAACTDLAGSSAWFERGFVTYSNEAKSDMLGVPAELIATHGAVSEPVARAMASGALQHSRAQVALSVTGIAGPSGGSPDKPVGTVWFGWATPDGVWSDMQHFDGDRAAVRAATVRHSITRLMELLNPPT